MIPYHKSQGHHTPIVDPVPVYNLTTPERFKLMFKGITEIENTSVLLQAINLLGAKYIEENDMTLLRLADGRTYAAVTTDDTWRFRPLWTEALPLIVDKPATAQDIKDLLLEHTVLVRGPILRHGRRHE